MSYKERLESLMESYSIKSLLEILGRLDLKRIWGKCRKNSVKVVDNVKNAVMKNPVIQYEPLVNFGGHYFAVVDDKYVVDYVMEEQKEFNKLKVKQYARGIYDKKDYYKKMRISK